MRHLAAAAAVLAVLLVAAGSRAGEPTPADQAPRAGAPARRTARALVTERHWSQLLDGYADSLSKRLELALQGEGTKSPGDLHAKVRRDLGAALPYARMIEVHAAELERHFSSPELDAITRFYEGPTGRKLLRELPAVGEAVNGSFQELLAAIIPDIVHRNAPSLGASGGVGSGPGQAQPDAK